LYPPLAKQKPQNLQTIEVEYTDKDGKFHRDVFKETLGLIDSKMSFIVECHLFENNADFTKSITIKYIPEKTHS